MAKISERKSQTSNNVHSLAKYRGKTTSNTIVIYLAFIISLIALLKSFNAL